MAFFDSLRRMVGADRAYSQDERLRLVEAWGLSDTSHPEFPGRAPAADPAEMAAPPQTTEYDVVQWRKKLKRVLDKLPASQGEWDVLLTDARALALSDDWVRQAQIEEFTLLVRRAVADREFTPEEHRKLGLARELIGMSEAETEALVQGVVADAEAFFGKSVEGA